MVMWRAWVISFSDAKSCTTPVVWNIIGANSLAKEPQSMRNGASPVIQTFLKLDPIATNDKCAGVLDVMGDECHKPEV